MTNKDQRNALKNEVIQIIKSQFRRKSIEYHHKDVMTLIKKRTNLLNHSVILDIFDEHSDGGTSKLNLQTINKIKKDICFVIDDSGIGSSVV